MLSNYLKVAIKVLLRRKLFTAISLFGISVTLVVLVVAVAMLDHVFGPQAPEVRQDRSVAVYQAQMLRQSGDVHTSEPGYKLLDRYVRNLPGTERMTVFLDAGRQQAYREGARIDADVKRTDGEFWKILDFTFLEGGPFSSDDVAQGRFLAVINQLTRQKFFDGAPALGRTVELDRQRYKVVGVVQDVSALRPLPLADVWVPLTTAPSSSYRNELLGQAGGIVLARTRADIPSMRQELTARLKRWQPDESGYERLVARLDTPFDMAAQVLLGEDGEYEAHAERLWLSLGLACLLFMLLPAVNLVNLNVSRILERTSEIGVRKAFGASSAALVVQLVIENVLLTLIGGVIALLLSVFVLRALSASDLIPAARFALNLRVFLVGLGLSLLFGLISGVYPAWKMSRLHPLAALKGVGR